MKWYENWLQVFKIGEHTDSAGNTRTWTQEDLDTIVANYDPAVQEAPVVLGHPKTDEPAYAWVSDLRAEDGILFAKLTRVDPEFSLWVEKGLYRKISIALDADLNLRHVGFLGAANPAVRGLCNDFAQGEPVEFLQDFICGDAVKPCGQRRLLRCFAPRNDEQKASVIANPLWVKQSRPISSNFMSDNNTKGFNMFKKQSQQEFAQQVEELSRELEFAQKSQKRAEFSAFLDSVHAEAKITAEDKTRLTQVFEALSEIDAQCFSQSQDKSSVIANEVKQSQQNEDFDTLTAKFAQFLSALPPRVEFAELATRENSPKGTYRSPSEELGLKIAGSIKK